MKPDLFASILRGSLWVMKMSALGAAVVVILTAYRALA